MPTEDARFEVHVGGETDPRPMERSAGGPFRIALLGDFSGRSSRGVVERGSALAARRVMRVDRDEIDAVLRALAPELRVTLDPGEPPLLVHFAELEDFHPDRLATRLPLFQSLLELRREAASGSVHAPVNRRVDSAGAPPHSAPADGDLLEMILDSAPPHASTGGGVTAVDDLSAFVLQSVKPHAVPEASASQAEIVGKIDAVLEATMRVLLHSPEFQALEALWRGTDFFLRRLDTDADLHVYLVDVSRAELAADLAEVDDGASRGASATRQLLARIAPSGEESEGWSLIVGNYLMGPGDVDLIARIAALGRSLGAPVIAGATSALGGTPSFASAPDPDEWNSAVPNGWDALRRSANAPYVGLALPRLFLRLPYGKSTDVCSVIPFEEMDDSAGGEAHENFLWANGAMACALIVASGVAERGVPATRGTIDRLPLHVEIIDGEPRSVPCAEALLTPRAVSWLLDRGLTPLESKFDADVVRAPRVQSIAFPPRALAFSAPRSE